MRAQGLSPEWRHRGRGGGQWMTSLAITGRGAGVGGLGRESHLSPMPPPGAMDPGSFPCLGVLLELFGQPESQAATRGHRVISLHHSEGCGSQERDCVHLSTCQVQGRKLVRTQLAFIWPGEHPDLRLVVSLSRRWEQWESPGHLSRPVLPLLPRPSRARTIPQAIGQEGPLEACRMFG